MPSLLKVFKGPAVGPDGLPTVAERVRLATLKTLAGPDVQANNAVVALTQQGREVSIPLKNSDVRNHSEPVRSAKLTIHIHDSLRTNRRR